MSRVDIEDVKREFGLRLSGMVRDRGWNQSELARRADMGRDNVSGYMRGKFLPREKHFISLCEALGVGPEELIPEESVRNNILSNGIDPAGGALRMTQVSNTHYRLYINQVLPLEAAMQIIQVVKEHTR